jgi:hypothetical protein
VIDTALRWQDTALLFADAGYAPDWSPSDRPAWPIAATAPFATWTAARLEEFDPIAGGGGLLRAARAVALASHVPDAAVTLHAALSRIDFERVRQRYESAAMREMKGGRAPSLDKVERAMLKEAEAIASGGKRRGPARAAPLSDHDRAVRRAAWDIWTLRRVIVPRFWPEKAGEQIHLPRGMIHRIIVARYAVAMHDDAERIALGASAHFKKSRMASA